MTESTHHWEGGKRKPAPSLRRGITELSTGKFIMHILTLPSYKKYSLLLSKILNYFNQILVPI